MFCSPPEPPDTTHISEANERIAARMMEIQEEQYKWTRERADRGIEIADRIASQAIAQGRWSQSQARRYARQAQSQRRRDQEYERRARERGDETRARADRDRAYTDVIRDRAETRRGQADETLGMAGEDRAVGQRLRDEYAARYPALEGQFIAEVQHLLSPEAQEIARGKAASQVAQSFNAARTNAEQRLRAMGIDPSQGRALDDQTLNVAEAAATAQAMNDAADTARETGLNRLGEAIRMGDRTLAQAAQMEAQSQGLRGQALGQGAQALATEGQGIQMLGQADQTERLGMGYDQQGAAYGDRQLGLAGAAQGFGGQALNAGNSATGAVNSALGTGAGAVGGTSRWGTGAVGANTGAAGILDRYGAAQRAAHQTPIMDLAGLGLGAWAGGGFSADGGYVGLADGGQTANAPLDKFETGAMVVRQPVPATAFAMDAGASGVYGAAPTMGIPVPTNNVLTAPDGGLTYGPGNGTGTDDRVPAMVSQGEYIIPADVVRKKGTDFFDKMVEKLHTPAAVQQAMGAHGGPQVVPVQPTAVAPMGQAPAEMAQPPVVSPMAMNLPAPQPQNALALP